MKKRRSIGLGKKAKPQWFKAIVQGGQVTEYLSQQGKQMQLTTLNNQTCFVGWQGLGLQDIQACLDDSKKEQVSGENANETMKTRYMYDMQWNHNWRNNSNAPVHLSFWKLVCRRDIPAYRAGTSAQSAPFTPVADYKYDSCLLQDPGGWTNPIANDMQTSLSSGWSYAKVGTTPYSSPFVTKNFKISKMFVSKGAMKVHNVLLRPGEELTFSKKRTRPYGTSFAKFYLSYDYSADLGDQWECLKETPLMFITMRGVNVHDSVTTTNVQTGKGWVDYTVIRRGCFVRSNHLPVLKYNPFADAAAFGANATVHEEVGGVAETEAP